VHIRVPSRSIGFMISVNDEVYGVDYFRIAQYWILDELLGLTPIDWEDRILGQKLCSPPVYTRRPPKDAAPPPLTCNTYSASECGPRTLRPYSLSGLRLNP